MPVTLAHPADARASRPPTGPYRWSQRWRDVFFLHWPAPHDWLRDQLPPQLEIDMFADQAWVSLVGFRLEQVRLRSWPTIPLCSRMLELNFRTYVRYHGEPAIYFLTMHANHRLMVAAARWITPLPYSLAAIDYQRHDDRFMFRCETRRTRRPVLTTDFQPVGFPAQAVPDTLDAWLVERYVAYAGDAAGRLFRMPVTHEPWQLQPAELSGCKCAMSECELKGGPSRCHYSPGVAALLWPLTEI